MNPLDHPALAALIYAMSGHHLGLKLFVIDLRNVLHLRDLPADTYEKVCTVAEYGMKSDLTDELLEATRLALRKEIESPAVAVILIDHSGKAIELRYANDFSAIGDALIEFERRDAFIFSGDEFFKGGLSMLFSLDKLKSLYSGEPEDDENFDSDWMT